MLSKLISSLSLSIVFLSQVALGGDSYKELLEKVKVNFNAYPNLFNQNHFTRHVNPINGAQDYIHNYTVHDRDFKGLEKVLEWFYDRNNNISSEDILNKLRAINGLSWKIISLPSTERTNHNNSTDPYSYLVPKNTNLSVLEKNSKLVFRFSLPGNRNYREFKISIFSKENINQIDEDNLENNKLPEICKIALFYKNDGRISWRPAPGNGEQSIIKEFKGPILGFAHNSDLKKDIVQKIIEAQKNNNGRHNKLIQKDFNENYKEYNYDNNNGVLISYFHEGDGTKPSNKKNEVNVYDMNNEFITTKVDERKVYNYVQEKFSNLKNNKFNLDSPRSGLNINNGQRGKETKKQSGEIWRKMDKERSLPSKNDKDDVIKPKRENKYDDTFKMRELNSSPISYFNQNESEKRKVREFKEEDKKNKIRKLNLDKFIIDPKKPDYDKWQERYYLNKKSSQLPSLNRPIKINWEEFTAKN